MDTTRDITRRIIQIHKRYYGRGATTGRSFFVHDDLVVVELHDVYTTAERTLIEKGQVDAVRRTRQTFQSAMRDEFVGTVEEATGRRVVNYDSLAFIAPDTLLEIFLLEPASDRQSRIDRESREDAGEAERPEGGLA